MGLPPQVIHVVGRLVDEKVPLSQGDEQPVSKQKRPSCEILPRAGHCRYRHQAHERDQQGQQLVRMTLYLCEKALRVQPVLFSQGPHLPKG